MECDVEHAARVGKQRDQVQNGDAHGPEAMRKERERDGSPCSKQVDGEMTGVERREIRRHEQVEQLVRADHRHRDRRHHPFGTSAPPGGIADSYQQEGEKQGDPHAPRLSCGSLAVKRGQAAAVRVPAPASAAGGHSWRS